MFLVRCWDVYNTTYTPNSASVEWQIQEERSTYGGCPALPGEKSYVTASLWVFKESDVEKVTNPREKLTNKKQTT